MHFQIDIEFTKSLGWLNKNKIRFIHDMQFQVFYLNCKF
jgi:hypothetical protein